MAESKQGGDFANSDAYEVSMGRRSRLNGELLLQWLSLPNGLRWLDVGCGTGALSAVILNACAPERITGIDPSEAQIKGANERITNAEASFRVANATDLPFEGGDYDAAVASYVLNFVPDPQKMISEMARVVRPSGTVAVSVFDYVGGGDPGRHFWQAIQARHPSLYQENFEKRGWNITRPETIKSFFENACLTDVDAYAIECEDVFDGFESYWTTWVANPTSGTAQFAKSLDPDELVRFKAEIKAILRCGDNQEIRVLSRSWAVRGEAPKM